MKGIISFFLVMLLAKDLNSQITKKNWLVGGSADFSSIQHRSDAAPEYNAIQFQLSGIVGYFIFDKFVTGLKPGYDNSTVKTVGSPVSSNMLAIGPFVRYYFLPNESRVNLLVETTYQFGFNWSSGNQTLHSHQISIEAGPEIFFNTSVGIEFTVGYSSLKYPGYRGSINTVNAGIGFQFHLEKETVTGETKYKQDKIGVSAYR